MLIKTPEFLKQFLTDLQEIVILSKKYRDFLTTLYTEAETHSKKKGLIENSTKYNEEYARYLNENMNGDFRPITFLGSFPRKDFGSIISDIDLYQYLDKFPADNIQKRLAQILMNPSSKFSFIRFYCGEHTNLGFPWKITSDGCVFDFENIRTWMKNIKEYVPERTYTEIRKILIESDSLSISDLIQVEKLTEKYISLSWKKDEIIAGFKMDKVTNHKYDFVDVLKKNETKKKVVKMLYTYTDKLTRMKEYCLVDVSLNTTKNTADILSLYSYYTKNMFKKFKEMKFLLPNELKAQFMTDTKTTLTYMSSVSTRLELLNKVKDYRLLDDSEYKRLKKDLVDFARKNNYTSITETSDLVQAEKDIQVLISSKVDKLYSTYSKLVKPEHEKYIIYLQARELESDVKILQSELALSTKETFCPFLMLNKKQVYEVVDIAKDINIEPLELIKCINQLKGVYSVEDILTTFKSSKFLSELRKK
jgi:hypothetical protein